MNFPFEQVLNSILFTLRQTLKVELKMVEQDHGELTQAEAELYDRQIRLWGLENQKR